MIRKIASTNWFDAGDPTAGAESLDLTPKPTAGEALQEPTPLDAITPPSAEDVVAALDPAVATVPVVTEPTPPPPSPPPLPPEVPTPPARERRSNRKSRMAAPAAAAEAATTAASEAALDVPRAHLDNLALTDAILGRLAEAEERRDGDRRPRTRVARRLGRPDTKKPARTRADRPRTAKVQKPRRQKRATSRRRRVASLAITALLIGAWSVTLRPTWMGGPASVLTVRGISMEPKYHYGDIVIAHQSSDYEAGDVIAFRVPEGEIGAGTVVIHRIIGGDATTGFITQGDNNPDPDEWLPVPTDILGVARFHIPAIGKLVGMLRTVPGIALVAGLLAALLVVFGTEGSGERRLRTGRRAERATLDRATSEPPVHPAVNLEPAPVVIAELTLEVAADRVAIEPIPDDDPLEDLITPPPLPTEPPILTTDPLEDLISLPPREPTALDTALPVVPGLRAVPDMALSPMPVARRTAGDETEAPIVGEHWGDLEHLAAILRERARPNAVFDDDLDEVVRPLF